MEGKKLMNEFEIMNSRMFYIRVYKRVSKINMP